MANNNEVKLSDYKGEVIPCPYCKKEEVLMGTACKWCLGNFYLAKCTNCGTTGKETKGALWDGGRSKHTSTCTPCGGTGYFPARASEYIPTAYPSLLEVTHLAPTTITTLPNLVIHRTCSKPVAAADQSE